MNKKSFFLKKLLRILLLISIIAFIISYFYKNRPPSLNKISEVLYQEPLQTEISMEPLSIQKEEFTYNITPRLSYELYGLIVSDYDSENWLDLSHEKDPLNTKDVCVIWGDNIKSNVYQQMKFTHGEWTCYAEFKSNVDFSWYSQFSSSRLSNNHLLPKDENVYKEMKKAAVGDQIHFKGYLVDYSITTSEGEKGSRTTSVSRDDTGCEIIYVTEIEVFCC